MGRAIFNFSQKSASKAQKRAILHTSQANGGARAPPPPWLRYCTVPMYRTRTITKKAYRTSVPYFLAKIEAYCTVPYCHPW